MKIDTSSYYPESPLNDFDDKEERGDEEINNKNEKPEPLPDFIASTAKGGNEVKEDSEEERVNGAEIDEKEGSEEDLDDPHYDPTEGERFLDGVSTFLSWTLVPLMMPVYGALMAFYLSILNYMPVGTKWGITLIIALINVVIPSILIMMLKKIGFIQDIGLNGRKERLIPYIVTIVCMGATALFIRLKHGPEWFVMFYAGGGVAAIINLLVNFRWKISAHAAGIAGIVALLIRILHDGTPMPGLFTWLIVWIAASGLMGSARVWLGRHTAAQVLAGFAVGFCSVFFLTMI